MFMQNVERMADISHSVIIDRMIDCVQDSKEKNCVATIVKTQGGRSLGLWESLHNPGFKQVEFDLFRSQAGHNAFTMSPSVAERNGHVYGLV